MPQQRVKVDFTLGADPEFGLLDQRGNRVDAHCIRDNNLNEAFGRDGSGAVAELRPCPAKDPFELVANIRSILQDGAATGAAIYQWKAGSSIKGEPIGGHIHFGLKNVVDFNQTKLLRALDVYLGQTVLLLEDPNEARERRQGHDYGFPSDVREQPWGPEYRALSSWLTSPYIAAGVLCLAKTVAWEAIYGEAGATRASVDEDAFLGANIPKIRKVFAQTWQDIKRFELYPRYRDAINFLAGLIRQKRNWFPSCEMKRAWGLQKVRVKPSLPHLFYDQVWSRSSSGEWSMRIGVAS